MVAAASTRDLGNHQIGFSIDLSAPTARRSIST